MSRTRVGSYLRILAPWTIAVLVVVLARLITPHAVPADEDDGSAFLIAADIGRGHSFPNGFEWPASFRPYGRDSLWNRRLPSNPKRYTNSDAIVALAERGDSGATIRTSEYGGGYDYSHPVVFASNADPIVTAHCTQYCPVGDYKLHVPAKARPAGGSDHHLAVVQPDGTEDDFWGTQSLDRDWRNGDALVYAGGRPCGNFYTGPGVTRGAATAGGACLAGGLIRAAELEAGLINHALFLTTSCTDPAKWVFPATQLARNCAGAGPHVPNGAHIWLDLPDSQIESMSLPAWQKAILRALHDYGGYIMDGGGENGLDHTTGLINVMFEDDAQFRAFGRPSPMQYLGRTKGWTAVDIKGARRYIAADNWQPVSFATHLHIIDPCYARGTC